MYAQKPAERLMTNHNDVLHALKMWLASHECDMYKRTSFKELVQKCAVKTNMQKPSKKKFKKKQLCTHYTECRHSTLVKLSTEDDVSSMDSESVGPAWNGENQRTENGCPKTVLMASHQESLRRCSFFTCSMYCIQNNRHTQYQFLNVG